MKNSIRLIWLLALLVAVGSRLSASHNTSRYFPFFERTSDYVINQKTFIEPTLFFSFASSAVPRGAGHAGIAELWGKYDLKDVISSLQKIDTNADPVMEVTQSGLFSDKSIVFGVEGKIDAVGLALRHEHYVGSGFSVGAWIPLMNVRSYNQFTFKPDDSDSYFKYTNDRSLRHTQSLQVDHIRRVTHQKIGFKGNEYSQAGFGDLDLYARWGKLFDHALMMKSVSLNFQTGVTAPTGILSKNDYPSTVSVMGDGHWSLHGDLVSEFELKQDWRAGIIIGFAHQFSNTRDIRLAVGDEPTIFSAMTGRVKIKPGVTFKCSPYFTLENVKDGLHLQGRYTYRRHAQDDWTDLRADQTIKSFLNDLTLKQKKEYLSKWSSHYFTLQLTYDCATALKKLPLNPIFYGVCDIPVGVNGASNTTEVAIGARLHF